MDNAQIGEYIIQQIREGIEGWEMPWHKGIREAINPATQKTYHGQNAVTLWIEGQQRGYESVEWATLKQWSSLRGRLRKGCKGIRVIRPRLHKQSDIFGGTTSKAQGFNFYTVFNYEDVNGIDRNHPDLFENLSSNSAIENELAERVVSASQAIIKYEGDVACYIPSENSIYMPKRSSFIASKYASASENFYATLLHELVHWTEKHNRCNRKAFIEDSRAAYAFEELVADLGAAILNTRFHKLPEPRKGHAAYINGWLDLLESDISFFYKAIELAQTATDWLCAQAKIHNHNYEWISEADSDSKSNSENDYLDWAASAATKESTEAIIEAKKPLQAQHVQLISSTSALFRSYSRLKASCGNCAQEFSVTLHRSGKGSYCSGCDVYNLISLPTIV